MIFQKGDYTKPVGDNGWFFKGGKYMKPMGFDGWFFKGESTQYRWVVMGDFSKGGVHKTDGFWNIFLLPLKIKRLGRLFRQIR